MNSIIQLLDLEDEEVTATESSVDGLKKFLTIESKLKPHFCPQCGFRMHSRGIRTRTISHPILQDGYELILLLKQRRWRCTNHDCRYEINGSFRFVDKKRRNTNASDMLIVLAFKDLSLSASAIARRYNTSDTHALDVFDKYVKLDRLPLTDIISVDEVHLDMDDHCKYALVIQDFYTGEPIDILRSRREDVTLPYFAAIPPEERNSVKYLLSDMYKPYIAYVEKYFPNAIPVVDSFHVIQWVIHEIDNYIRGLVKKFRQRDREREEAKSIEVGYKVVLPISDEMYLLTRYRWLIMSNNSKITYHSDPRIDKHFRCFMNTYDYERELFRIDSRLERLRDLKEQYVQFNERYAGHPVDAVPELDRLIEIYFNSNDSIFMNFASLLRRYHDPIINSFIMVERYGGGNIYDSRLSNGPIESLNRKIKDLKREGRGFRNFEHFRNRFLYSTRNNPTLNAISDYNPVQYFDNNDDFQEDAHE